MFVANITIPARDLDAAPSGARVVDPVAKLSQRRPFLRRTSHRMGVALWRHGKQVRIEAQAADECRAISEAMHQLMDREAAVAHEDDAPPGQPADNLKHALPGPVRQPLVPPSKRGAGPLEWGEQGEHGQGFDTS